MGADHQPAGLRAIDQARGRLKLVSLETPYAGNIERNLAYARACMRDSIERGEAPIASHLLYTQPGILQDDNLDERRLGMEIGFAWNRHAEETVVYTDLGITPGMERGIARARADGREVTYRKIDWISP